MRLIYTLEDQKAAYQFSNFLKQEGIENQCEIIVNTDWGSSDYGTYKCHIWIVDEDQLETSLRWVDEFKQNPNNPVFKISEKKSSAIIEPLTAKMKEAPQKLARGSKFQIAAARNGLGKVTIYILMVCVLLFMYSEVTSPANVVPIQGLPIEPLTEPPIFKALMYDYPAAYEIVDKLVKAYGLEKLQNIDSLPQEGVLLEEKYAHTPYWQGIYDKLVAYFQNPDTPWNFDAPMFEKIKQGEIWRLFTPCLLHANIFHLFFNMIWLIYLGKIVEDRIGMVRYIFFVIITAVVSNTAQYLMSGPNFVGYSGVIVAMLGFIWARQREAPWESYNLAPGVISFVFFFIMTMLGIQVASFIMEVYWRMTFFPSIANTAHIIGGITGYILGRFNLMPMKQS